MKDYQKKAEQRQKERWRSEGIERLSIRIYAGDRDKFLKLAEESRNKARTGKGDQKQ